MQHQERPLVHTVQNTDDKGLQKASSPQPAKSSPFPERNAKKDYTKRTTQKQPRSSTWRIKINKRKRGDETYYHWLYAIKIDGKEKTKYGGAIETLPDPERFEQYKKRSKRYGKQK